MKSKILKQMPVLYLHTAKKYLKEQREGRHYNFFSLFPCEPPGNAV